MILATTFFMSQGARNWPFLTLTTLAGLGRGDQQVGLAAQEGRDLQHVDGLRRRAAHCSRSCTSVSTGRPSVSRISAKIGSACVEADAARACRDWCGSPCRTRSCRRGRCRAAPAISFSADAISSACARLSSWQGPAISASGSALPKRDGADRDDGSWE